MLRSEERGKELKVPYHANTAAARDGNLPYIIAICLYSQQLITLKSNLRIAAIGFYKIKIVKRPIFITFLVNSFSSLVLFTLFTLSLVVSPRALKIASNSFLIFFI